MKLKIPLVSMLWIMTYGIHAMLNAQAEPQTPHERPVHVGVALSGGGALGLAHIGVLRYFEEHHIPIDAIAGTSMGGLVGGFYATGLDSKHLAEMVEHADRNILLNPNPRFIDQPVVDKQSWNRTFGNLTLQFGKGFSLPLGLNSGEALSLLLSRTTLAYSDISSFDDLPIPFRCVATDLISGNAVVLKNGSLPQAMRATMSIPGIFSPVKLNGMVLVDGGIVQTVPVEVVRDMGAQKVIAVAFEHPKVKPEELKSLPDILRRTAAVSTAQNERRSLGLADLVISIDAKKFSTSDYGRWREIIQAGYDAANRMSDELKQFEVTQEEWDRYLQARSARMRPAIERGRVVAVEAPTTSFQQKAQAEIHRELGDRAVPPRALEAVLTGIAAATAVPAATYEWDNGTNEAKGYRVTIAQRPGDQLLVRPSFQYRLSPGEPGRAGLQISTATAFKNAYKARLLGTLNIGYDPGIQMEDYRPFGGSPYFIAPDLFVQRLHINSYRGPSRSSETRDRFGGALYGGIGTWRFAQLRIGVEAGYDSYSSSPTVDGVRAKSGAFVRPELRWIYDTQDSGGLPTHGVMAEDAAGYSFSDVDYPYFQQHLSAFQPLGKNFSIFGMSRQSSSFGRKLDYYEQFTSGGEGQLSAFRHQEFHANTLVTTGAGIILHGPVVPRISVYPRFATWYEAGRFDLGSNGWQTHQSASSGVFLPTPIGAFGLTLSFDEDGNARWRLMLGSL
jgi:NTE family protein